MSRPCPMAGGTICTACRSHALRIAHRTAMPNRLFKRILAKHGPSKKCWGLTEAKSLASI